MSPNPSAHLFLTSDNMAACTDLYELTMAAGYFAQGLHNRATFELSMRKFPKNRSYLVAAGLEQAVRYLTDVRFSTKTIRYLRAHQAFARVPSDFFTYLSNFRFTGDVIAVPEGTVVFAGEPLLYVRAPIIEAQIAETFLLATINYQTAVATKAARIVHAAQGRPIADFGTRRAHGPQAGLLAARAAYIGGCAATSNLLAGQDLGIPLTGTQAHSWIMAFSEEREAFRRYAEVFPDTTILLIDTYDTLKGARHAAELGPSIKAVRLDSGDTLSLSRRVRKLLDAAGLPRVKIVASGDLNEYRIHKLLKRGAPIDLFGVGTEMVTSRDDPALSGVYKLVEIERRGAFEPAFKLSPDKQSLPCLKQIRRRSGSRGTFRADTLCLWREKRNGSPLLRTVLRNGKIIRRLPGLRRIRARCRAQMRCLPQRLNVLTGTAHYPVEISPLLRRAAEKAKKESKG